MTVMIVDWLGRGGIAQTTEAWSSVLADAGHEVLLVTRPNRELGAAVLSLPVRTASNRIQAHAAVIDAAVGAIADHRPSTVVIQNYLVPALEWKVYRAASRAGSRLVFVVHDHRLHSRLAGNHVSLRRCIRSADVLVTHSRFVARSIAMDGRRSDVIVVPHPVPIGMLRRPRPERPPLDRGSASLALHFGILRRRYKGTSTVLDLARAGVDGWGFALIGQGAPSRVDGAQVIGGFVDSGTLVSAVSTSDATLLPYSYASQSGAVVLAQALGSAVVVSAVGGIPEQVEDGTTGRLVRAGAAVTEWHDILVQLTDKDSRAAMTLAAQNAAWRRHAQFTSEVRRLVV